MRALIVALIVGAAAPAAAQRVADPYPSAPADPWAGVDGNGPVRYHPGDFESILVGEQLFDCSTAHDHCLMPLAWFVERDGDRTRDAVNRHVALALFGPTGTILPTNTNGTSFGDGEKVTAYRTVPVTRRTLVKGALVASLAYPKTQPTDGRDAFDEVWAFGVVGRVDWDRGTLYYVGRSEPHWIASARLAVMSWKAGAGVTILGGARRDQLAVAAKDVILPASDRPSVADPWAEVGADKKPREPVDDAPVMPQHVHDCDAAHDHCLRPWVWFVAIDKSGAQPARRAHGAWERASVPGRRIDHAGWAYRTAPATVANLAVGALVVRFPDSGLPDDEATAMDATWTLGTIAEVEADAGLARLRGDDQPIGLDALRVVVVAWFPGEPAQAPPHERRSP